MNKTFKPYPYQLLIFFENQSQSILFDIVKSLTIDRINWINKGI